MPQPRRSTGSPDRYGFDDTRDYVGAAVGRLLPARLTRRCVAVSVATDRARYAPGDPVRIRVTLRNRLPVPVAVTTPTRRPWGWSVDGHLEAEDVPRRSPGGAGSVSFRAREAKTFEWTWDGRIRRVEGDTERWRPLAPGEHELRAFLATADGTPTASTTIAVDDGAEGGTDTTE